MHKNVFTPVLFILLIAVPTAGTLAQDIAVGEPANRGRAGGIARDAIVPQDGKDMEGQEEGMPRFRERLNDRIAPDFLPPERLRWRLGVFAYNTDTGIVVTRVVPGSAAERTGLERGDRIVAIDGFQVGWVEDHLYPLSQELQRQADGRGNVMLLIQNVRNSELLNRRVRLDRWR